MVRDFERLRAAFEENLDPIVAEEGTIIRILHTCESARWTPNRFPYRLISIMTACAAVLLFVSVTMFLDGMRQVQGIDTYPQAITDGGAGGMEPVSSTGGEMEHAGASYMVAVSLTPALGDNGLYGYMDAAGIFIIEPLYTEAEPFVGDRARVLLNGERFYIDAKGAVIEE